MLHLPQNASTVGTLIGIDPGSNKLGFCVMHYDLATMELLDTNAFTVRVDKLVKKGTFTGQIHGERFARIEALGAHLYFLFLKFRPNAVAQESPFFSLASPTAFEPLVEIKQEIRRTLLRYDPWLELQLIDPPTVKLGVGSRSPKKGEKVKDMVRDAVLKLTPGLHYIGATPLERLDDNAIDSIAVGYSYLQILRGTVCPKPRR